jgi:glutaconyl-CoA/methylmalonyl-CoA decarboxylase subunit gamma
MVKHLKITVEGKIYDVVVEDVTEDAGSTFYQSPSAAVTTPRPAPVPSAPAAPAPAPAAGGPADKAAPLAGVIIEISVNVGQQVKVGDKVAVIEAMKMKTVVSAHKDGKVSNIAVKVGDAVEAGQTLVTIS